MRVFDIQISGHFNVLTLRISDVDMEGAIGQAMAALEFEHGEEAVGLTVHEVFAA